mmetsp:Transcript_45456/g.54700  ORF Transcript_45456/g.54700 Transcript_45456/m.54700 type:complete len:726 (-) Transcript_45456:69-2246(-)
MSQFFFRAFLASNLLSSFIRFVPCKSQKLIEPKITKPFFFSQEMDYEDIEGMPEPYDEWCAKECSSFDGCSSKFGKDHVDLRIKIDLSAVDGPGEHLNFASFLGDTISRQSFETQFIFDISTSLEISACRLFVLNVEEGDIHYSWEAETVIISFRMYPSDLNRIQMLTKQIQDPLSAIFRGKVTKQIDPMYGLVASKWDIELKLMYSIDIVGANITQEENEGVHFFNQGGYRRCEKVEHPDGNPHLSKYCEFESMFRDDIAQALSIQRQQIDVMFMKEMGHDSIVVSFRLIPETIVDQQFDGQEAYWIVDKISDLSLQVKHSNSKLYQGNVTVRVDPTFGLSGSNASPRIKSSYLHYSAMPTTSDEYERCKNTQRCSRGWVYYNQSTGHVSSTEQLFAGGTHHSIPLFANFEDWRQGTQGWRQSHGTKEMCNNYSTNKLKTDSCLYEKQIDLPEKEKPFGAHWSPFNFSSLGPSVPSYNSSINIGLVLNKKSLHSQLEKQLSWIQQIQNHIEWLEYNVDIATLDAMSRSRNDVRREISETLHDKRSLLVAEELKFEQLSSSQCLNNSCDLTFNTSSLELFGSVNATGVIAHTSDGTEVSVWSFDSIDLGPEVKINLIGQRPMALVSRSSTYIDTNFVAGAGTLGGFPGGYSVGRPSSDRAVEVCSVCTLLDLHSVDNTLRGSRDECHSRASTCRGDIPLSKLTNKTLSNNVNGPGSGSARVYLKT